MISDRVNKILDKHGEMKREKEFWYPLYQLIGEYIMTRKQHFSAETVQGQMQNAQVFDSTAIKANNLMSSSLIGALWPNTAKSMQIIPPDSLKGSTTKEITDYYKFVTDTMASFMDNPKCNFTTALQEYMLDQGAFGTSGISIFEQPNDDIVPVIYSAVDVKALTIDEGRNKFVDTVYTEYAYSPRQMIMEYGYEGVSQETRDAFDNGDSTKKIKVLVAIEPRIERDPYGFGVKNMPVSSMHIEIDSRKILRESGFSEMPILIVRFSKGMNEKYGRSPGMDALPDILEVNALREAMIMATEKTLDPPLAVLDDGTLGGGTINTSAGAINVFSVAGRMGNTGAKPIEPLYTVGELNDSNQEKKDLQETIGNHFFLDRLMDLNNETRMTLGETNIRNELRGQSLGSVYTRQITELFNPALERTFNILLKRNFLGVVKGSQMDMEMQRTGQQPTYIPDAVLSLMTSGKEAYKIKYISPAVRMMQAEEVTAITDTLTDIQPIATIDPTVLDIINFDETLQRLVELRGAPGTMINDDQTVANLRQARQQSQQQQAQLEAAKQQSEIARNQGIAQASVVNAQR